MVGACGSFAHYQRPVAAALEVPVFLSAMTQVPLVLGSLGPGRRLCVVAAWASALTDNVFAQCGVIERDRLAIVEADRCPAFRAWLAVEPVDPAELRDQVVEVALDRAFLMEPLPTSAAEFQRRLDEGRGRLTLIAQEVARLAATVLADYAAAARKIKDTKNQPEATADAAQQLQRLVPRRFLADTPWARLQHLPRYLKGIVLRLDKLRADSARDAARLAELRPQEQRYWRLVAERKGAVDERMEDFRWLLEELRVSFFAQELRTPQPVSVKRLDKVWAQLQS